MQTQTATQVYEPVRRITKKALWIEKKYLCMAAIRLTDAKVRQIKHGCFSYSWQWQGNEVNVNSIADAQRVKYGIPDNDRLTAIVNNLKMEANREQCAGNWTANITTEIDTLYHKLGEVKANYHGYYNLINEKYNVSKDNCKRFAEKWAVWEYIKANRSSSKNDLTIYHAAYDMLFPGHLTTKVSFLNFASAIDLKGIENKVIDQRAITKVAKRITSFQYAFLQSLYIQPQKIQPADAYKKLAEACEGLSEKPYSLASVKNYYREFENNAELFTQRYGAAKAQKQQPYASLLPAMHRNTQWQQDGWTMPFWGANYQRYVLYLVRDNHSRKIVGWSIAESENTTLILEALEDAMRNTGVFPGEIVMDKHSFTKTEIAARICAETERMGAIWTVTINAQRNQLAERYNQYLDALCKDFAGYLGKNLTATGKDARPSQEALTQYGKTANFKTADEIKAIAAHVVTAFNKMELEPLEGVSPNEKYAQSEDINAFKVSESERVALVRPMSDYKVTRGQIIIKVGMKRHEFQLPAALISRYNNRKVAAVWEDLAQGIYISDIATGEELGCIPPKRKIHGAIPDQTEEDRKWLNQMTGRTNGVTTTARKSAQEKIKEGLAQNPEAIALINHYSLPKDIRALAQKDSELKRAMAEQGINYNNLPIRAQQAVTLPVAETKQGKGKESPFAPASNEIRQLDMNEVF